ncbi:MAG TPA: FAD-dependent oxidoreductase [Candidatus Acidoferrum sp.]|nr:FAD-dependent oxidoreductase [Candidatus Acidoferrum sp.]
MKPFMPLHHPPSSELRRLKTVSLECDLAIIGGGLAGVCCAITAARAGVKTVLVQDRPVLGGNASSEVRLWILGATSHMGNNNRWAREGGVIDEILVENMYRNPEGNPLILDTVLLEKVIEESNIILLLNTAVHDLEKLGADRIRSVRAFCSQNSTAYEITAPLFCDASGDGIVGFLAGAAFRMGAEARSEFGEAWAPTEPGTELLGHSLYFYSRDTGRPVRFVPPSYALADITKIPRWRDFSTGDCGCRLWWLEWGGKLDTIHETETIKWELWKVAYGVWNFIKNSGRFPEAETLTLEWVGTIPGKRESRRFEGDYMLVQQDIVEQRTHADAVSFGGWAIDLHPADGVFSENAGCTQWHSKGIYQIPYRCLYSRNISNLFLAGRIISASHIAFGSTRVMATCANSAQAVAAAAALCLRDHLQPRDLLAPDRMAELQRNLLRAGQFIPDVALSDAENLTQREVRFAASSELKLESLPPNGETLLLAQSWAMLLPLESGPVPRSTVTVDAANATELVAELRVSSRPENHTPDVTLATIAVPLPAGAGQSIELRFDANIDESRYAFVCLMKNEVVSVHLSDLRVTGVLAVCHNGNKSVAKSATQIPPPGIGIDTFEFWTPHRRPGGKNFALKIDPPLELFSAANLTNGIARPTNQPNAWVAAFDDATPMVQFTWATPQRIGRIELVFDTDYDHPMESVLMGHPERVMPFCVQEIKVTAADGCILFECADNHQSRRTIRVDPPITTNQLAIELTSPGSHVPASLFEVRCYEL